MASGLSAGSECLPREKIDVEQLDMAVQKESDLE